MISAMFILTTKDSFKESSLELSLLVQTKYGPLHKISLLPHQGAANDQTSLEHWLLTCTKDGKD